MKAEWIKVCKLIAEESKYKAVYIIVLFVDVNGLFILRRYWGGLYHKLNQAQSAFININAALKEFDNYYNEKTSDNHLFRNYKVDNDLELNIISIYWTDNGFILQNEEQLTLW
ncbi:hypothetical protein OR1_02714 [Geobacter sp. OR-1]|uniref:hypothetical protein n=1 Tax=Geobacter sp. OR-1 TaxID=1266765 RepID=UPI000541B683|nr:hypothetical protein [Geobacter sp. OR-1]GAM10425.1 hypothetical protein OR1_02714 [Geobacter sp. OR-1]